MARGDAPAWRDISTELFGVGGARPVGARPAVPAPVGGTVVDEQARAAIAALTEALEAFGLVLPTPRPSVVSEDEPAPVHTRPASTSGTRTRPAPVRKG